LARVKEKVVDIGVDAGTEQMSFTGDFLLPSVVKSGLSIDDILALDGFLHYGGMVVADFGYDTDILEAGESIIYQETLVEAGMEASEVVVFA